MVFQQWEGISPVGTGGRQTARGMVLGEMLGHAPGSRGSCGKLPFIHTWLIVLDDIDAHDIEDTLWVLSSAVGRDLLGVGRV